MNQSDANLLLVITTVASRDDGSRIARQIIADRLAACVQCDGPIESHYVWDGKPSCDSEFRLSIKTHAAAWERLHQRLLELHPYQQPQIIAIPVPLADPGYAAWVQRATEF
jgi:periplasmic divalent cation tolerance protein